MSCKFIFLIPITLFLLQEEYDTHDPKGHSSPKLPFLMKRTKVIEIVAARDIVFALAHSGVCAAFSRGNNIPNYPVINVIKNARQYYMCR